MHPTSGAPINHFVLCCSDIDSAGLVVMSSCTVGMSEVDGAMSLGLSRSAYQYHLENARSLLQRLRRGRRLETFKSCRNR